MLHAVRMFTHASRISFATAALLAGSLLAANPASADDADCSVVDLSPATVTVGVSLKARVTFDVGTDCDEDADVNWYLTFNQAGATAPYTGPLLANFQVALWSKYTYIPGGAYTWKVDPKGYAGLYNVDIYAFIGDESDQITLPASTQPVTVLHRTTFGSTFNASPEPRRVGDTIHITGKLKYANWNSGAYEGVGEYVMLQFRPAGSDDYQDVKKVWDNGVDARTTVRATKTGTWRYHYAGDPANLTGASNSKGDTVKVTR